MAKQVSVKTERNPSNRDPEARSRPFTSVLLMALIVVPLWCILLRFVAFWDLGWLWLIGLLDIMLFGLIVPAVTLAYGYKVAKRVPFVIHHAALTVLLFGVATYVTVMIGWPLSQVEWWDRLLAVVKLPMWWVIIYLFGAVAVAMSWLIYRIDAFRASTGGDGDDSDLRKLLRLPEGARMRVADAVVTDTAIEVPVDHEGVPIGQIRQTLPALEEHPGVVRGRSAVIEGDRGGHSTLRIVHTDPHKTWRVWPGLSAPGGSYTEPIRTSYYSTGEVQWYSFVRTPEGFVFAPAPGEAKDAKLSRAKFASSNDTFKGAQGATGSGKSGGSAIECAEVASRRNVHLVYVDVAKLMQNAGWILDFCKLAAGSRSASGALFTALRRVGEVRTRILGNAGLRNFTDEACEVTGLSWVHIYADEFDVAKQNTDMEWLATKGRSLGFRLSFTLPRAVGDKLSTDIRAAVGMWEQYGITQDYDKGFVLSEETIAAGANPENFGVSIPGAHYLDRAPGIPSRMWAIDCRTFKTREDYGDLRRALEAARATFTPPEWLPEELEALGEVANYCSPSVVRNGHLGIDKPAPVPTAVVPQPTERTDMQATQQIPDGDDDLTDLPFDQQVQALLDDAPDIADDLAEAERDSGPIGDVRQPIPAGQSDGIELKTTKPKPPDREAAIADFENALKSLLGEDMAREFGNADVAAMMRFDMSPSWISKRFTGLCDGDILAPPGLTIERLGNGRFMLTRIA
jgi:hypothetical protein